MFCDLPLPPLPTIRPRRGWHDPCGGVLFVEPQGLKIRDIWYSKSYIRHNMFVTYQYAVGSSDKTREKKNNPNKKKLQTWNIGRNLLMSSYSFHVSVSRKHFECKQTCTGI